MIRILILGIGSPIGDDQIGWRVIEAFKHSISLDKLPPGKVLALALDRPGVNLIGHLQGVEQAIIIDAVQGGRAAGTIYRLDNRALLTETQLLSSHGFGVAQSLGLALALGELSTRIVLFGIELKRLSPDDGVSAEVMGAVPALLKEIDAEIRRI